MEATETVDRAGEKRWDIAISADACTALTQLRNEERDGVYLLLERLARGGVTLGNGAIAQRLPGGEPLYLLRAPGLSGGSDIRLVARVTGRAAIEVEDVVRRGTVDSVLRARVS